MYAFIVQKPLRHIPIEDIGGEESSTGKVAETRESSITRAEDNLQTRNPTLVSAVSSQNDVLSEKASPWGRADTEEDESTRPHGKPETASATEHEEAVKRTDSAMVDPGNPHEEAVVPGVPDTSIVPGVPDTSIVPGVPDTSIVLGVPDTSIVPGVPDTSIVPGVPDTSSVPGVPDTSSVPGVPDTSIQFQADWKNLRKCRSVLSQYFKVS